MRFHVDSTSSALSAVSPCFLASTPLFPLPIASSFISPCCVVVVVVVVRIGACEINEGARYL